MLLTAKNTCQLKFHVLSFNKKICHESNWIKQGASQSRGKVSRKTYEFIIESRTLHTPAYVASYALPVHTCLSHQMSVKVLLFSGWTDELTVLRQQGCARSPQSHFGVTVCEAVSNKLANECIFYELLSILSIVLGANWLRLFLWGSLKSRLIDS